MENKPQILDKNFNNNSSKLNKNFRQIKMKKIILSFLILFYSIHLWAQEDSLSVDEKPTPYDLLSNYYSGKFKPFKKGNFFAGLAFSLTDKKMENTDYLIQQVIDGDRFSYDILAKGGYYTGDYGMVLLNLNYFQDKFTGTVFRDPDTLQSNTISRGFAVTPAIRSSVPLSKNERLSFFTEIGLTFGNSNSLTRNTKNLDEVEKIYGSDFNFRIGLSPGITFFAMENFAFEIQLNVLGYDLSVSEKSKNNGPKSREVRQNVDFNINLLSVQLGLAYYFGANK